jgi:hypothetical protein
VKGEEGGRTWVRGYRLFWSLANFLNFLNFRGIRNSGKFAVWPSPLLGASDGETRENRLIADS